MAGRGPDPGDRRLFGPEQVPALREAVSDLSWLLGRGYATDAALALVGNKAQLTRRQRTAVWRAACTDAERAARLARRMDDVRGEDLIIDGFNLLIAVERGMSGGPIFRGRDTALRDLASIHGTYRLVEDTPEAIRAVARVLASLGAGGCRWLLDQPVSNSGRLAAALREVAEDVGAAWEVEVHPKPDQLLAASGRVVVTGDAWILDQPVRWFGLHEAVLRAEVPGVWLVDLS